MKSSDVRHYRFLERLIRVAERQVDKARENSVIEDKVFGSDDNFPFTEKSFKVSAPKGNEKRNRVYTRWSS